MAHTYNTGLYSKRAFEIISAVFKWINASQWRRSWTSRATRNIVDDYVVKTSPSGEIIFTTEYYSGYLHQRYDNDKRMFYASNIFKQLAKHKGWTWKRSNTEDCTLVFDDGSEFSFTMQELYFVYDALNKRSFKLVYTQDFIDKMIGTARDPFTSAQVEAFNKAISDLVSQKSKEISSIDNEYESKKDELRAAFDEKKDEARAKWNAKINESKKQLEEFLKKTEEMMAGLNDGPAEEPASAETQNTEQIAEAS